VIGNHEYLTTGAAGYFKYFGIVAGHSTKGYYSFDLGSWHIIVLNSQCRNVPGGCGYGSEQERWLRADLAAHRSRCTLAAWHEPRWSSGEHHSNPAYDAFWRDLSAAKAELVLSGHDHEYERFARLDASGHRNTSLGVRQFVVGTGGVGLRNFEAVVPGSEVRQNSAFGVLALTLRPSGYTWRFVSTGSSFSDSGQDDCH
jgi:3',5'-cyclic AMP phosphodiesterase CpdA